MISEAVRACALTGAGVAAMQDQSPPVVIRAETIMKGPAAVYSRADHDGIDHINIDSRGRTELGKQLTHMHRQDFLHPEFGPFRSVEGLIGFIRSGAQEDEFHWLHGMEARHRSRNLESEFIKGFREIVMEANYFKIVQNDELRDAFIACTLPFDHYYLLETNGRPIRPMAAAWLVPAFEDLRKLIRDGRPFPKVDYSGVKELEAQALAKRG